MTRMTRYYKLNSVTNDLVRLAPPQRVGGRMKVHLSPAEWAALGAFPCDDDDEQPVPPEGKMVEDDGWEVRDNAWHRKWRYVDVPLPPLSDYDAAMEDHLLQERSARGYTTREPTAYLASSNARWAADARDWVAHRDAVMTYALTLINGVQSGTIVQPTLAEFRANLPQITWSYQEDS